MRYTARNGKRVTVFVELKARFDEANNCSGRKMKAAGIRIIYSEGTRVHSKRLVKRKLARTQYFPLLH
jgi:polyphosphate kinase